MTMLIINADDLGRDTAINQAIIASFKNGHCSSATIMPNMPGFEEACNLVHENKLLKHVGLHLTLRDAGPLTETIKKLPVFCNRDGILSNATVHSPLLLSSLEQHALADEVRAQIARCRDFGLPLTHLDSHCHIHTNLAIANVVIAIALEQRIPHVRIARNCGSGIGLIKRSIKAVFNHRLKAKKLAATDYFGSVDDFLHLTRSRGNLQSCSMEVMVHPVLGATGRVMDRTGQEPIGDIVGRMPSREQAISYAFARCA
jgi:chitin disaccharide deacetylase